ncbi:Mariner transposase [Caligus rogercresseyi]|uniref:Mariner transposase n=1 Tax=Caligus rogercresseyi TaxID=217165 RepID=A0A7T8KDU5_CALRO|nr:Mariner transposase [Caligus rogercresseyi]
MDETWIHHFTPDQNDRHLSGQQLVNLVQSARKHNNRLERLWPRYFWICVV